MAQAEFTFAETWDVNRRLAELGLELDDLLQPADRGFVAWASCTPNHPKAIPGLWSWGETVCGLGERLIPKRWQRCDESNWPIVVNSAGTVALSVATGNEDTGKPDRDPLTASTKGPRTLNAIVANQQQLLFPGMLPPIEKLNAPGRATWLLLVYRDSEAREMRCELSRPIRMDEDGRVDGWAERIILPTRPFDGFNSILGEANGPQTPEITVEIRRRG